MRFIIFRLAQLALLWITLISGLSQEGPALSNLPQARVAGEISASRVSDPGKQGDWPAVAASPDGSIWVAWIEWNDQDSDRLLVRRRDPSGTWSSNVEVADGNWDHYSPQIVARGAGAMAIWSGQGDGNYDLFATTIDAALQVQKPERLTTAPLSDFNARAVADAKGDVTVVWQSFRSLNSDIYARRFSGNHWGPEVRVSESTSNDWEPAVALAPDGTAWISWDGYQTGNYDVYLRSFDGRKLGPTIAITTELDAQFHSSVAVDAMNRVWVAWDEGGLNWGKDFSAVSAAPGSRGLHYSRKIGVRIFANGRVQDPHLDYSALNGRMERYAELPHLMFDGGGTLWMVFRHWTRTEPTEIFHNYATRLDGARWSLPWLLAESSGHNSQHAALALERDGNLVSAYASDGRSATVLPTDPVHALHYNVYLASIPKGGEPPRIAPTDARLPPPGKPGPKRPRAEMQVNGQRYRLLMGDAHRHTDIRGHSGVDASVLDTYRYAIDAAQLDWLGTSDHNEVSGGRWADGLRDYQWWYTQKTVDLMTHAPVFFGVYSYEHSLARPAGHRNVLFLKRGGPLRTADRERNPDDNLPPNLWKWMTEHALSQAGQQVVIVPHTFGEKAQPIGDFKWDNSPMECLLEIYQGARSSYEAWRAPKGERRGSSQLDEDGHFVVNSLNRGNKQGFVSFSDHGSTHNSWAAVWVKSEDRTGLFEAMLARRTYAASDEMIIKVTADGHIAGEEFTASVAKPPLLKAEIAAPENIVRIDVVKDGKYIFTTRPLARKASIQFQDRSASPGKAYYYIRVFQTDTEKPDGDPEVAWTSPWFVQYH